jgi:cytoskeletal protein CcmA (bactofilin family)
MADSDTIIGESILVKGNLEGDEDLTVQGRIEGSINLSKTLIIEPAGVVKADVSVANAVISGIMVGNLAATDAVELTDTGRMVGDINAPRVIITEGALFKGQVDMGDISIPRPASSMQAKRPTPVRSEPMRRPSPPPVAKPVEKPPMQEKPTISKPAPVKAVARSSKKKVVVKKKRR